MLSKLKIHLVLLYTLSTGVILIGAMIVMYMLNISQLQKYSMERFLMTADSLTNQLQSSPMLNLSELSTLETKNHMIIHIEDNGHRINFEGSYQSKTKRELLIQRLKEAARLEGVSTTAPSSFTGIQRSRVTKINGEAGEDYYGCIVIIPLTASYRSITMLYSLSPLYSSAGSNAIIYTATAIVGILLLFFISCGILGKTLRPIRESNQKQVEFIASASHELRSPLAYIRTATGSLKSECLPHLPGQARETLQSYIDNTGEELQRMSTLIEDMLLLSSADSNTWTVHVFPTDGDTFFIEVYETLRRHSALHNHELRLDLPGELLGEISIDHQRIHQLLQILINNANSYTPDHSTITIAPRRVKKQLLINIIDHGPGIPDGEKDRVFDRYYRSDPSRSDRNHFGLGLNIARELTRLHQGSLTLHDTPGGGCTFQIMLPQK